MEMTKERAIELASWLASGLIEDDRDSAIEYMVDQCDMTKEEIEFLTGIEIETNQN